MMTTGFPSNDGQADILIVDDDPANIGVVARALEDRGHRVLVAQDGEEGLARAERIHPDLLLLDVMMPGLDGFEVCRRLQQNPATHHTPVIFMTALADMRDKLAAFEAGAVDYVTKPLQIEEVTARVETQLKLAAMQRQLEAQNIELATHRDHLERLVAERTAELSEINAQLRLEIAERRKAQEDLAAREREFRTLAENTPDNIVRYDRQCRTVFWNRQLQKTLGIDLSGSLGKTPNELNPGGQFAEYQARIAAVLASGAPDEIEITLPDSGDGERYHHVRFVAERDEEDSIDGVLAIGRDVTERKRAERELVLLNRALDHAFDATYLLDTDLRFRFVNEAAERALGYSRDELLSMNLLEVAPNVTREAVQELMRQTQDGRFPGTVESTHRRKDGSLFPVEVGATTFTHNGAPLFLTTVRDISARKESEQRLHSQQQALHAAVQNSPDAIVRYDRDCNRIYMNATMLKAFGSPVDGRLGTPPTEGPILDRPVEYLRLIRRVLETGEEQQAEMTHSVRGEERWLDLRFAPEFDAQGLVASVLVVGRNITERKRTEQALAESEGRYRQIFENVSDTLYLLEVTPDGRFRNLEVNPAFEASSGMRREKIIGRCTDETVPPEVAELVNAKYRRCIEAGTTHEEEAVLELPNGRRHYHSTMIPVRNEAGRIHRIVGISRDITDRVRARELLLAQLELDRRLTSFAQLAPGFMFSYRVNADGKGVFRYASPGVERLCGLPVAHLLEDASLFFDNIPPAESARIQAAMADTVARGEGCVIEYQAYHHGEQWLELRATPETEADGGILWHGYIVDVTPRKEVERQLRASEEALRASERQFRTLAENLPDNVVRYDRLGNIVYANPKMERQLALRPRSEKGASLPDPEEACSYRLALERVVETGEAASIEVAVRSPDGRAQVHQISFVAERRSNGEVRGALAIGRDITALKEAEQRLRESHLKLQKLARKRETAREEERMHIARELHDDLGQYLTALNLHVSVLNMGYGQSDPVMAERLGQLASLIDRMKKVVRNLSRSLRPAALDMGIEAALEQLVVEFAERYGVRCRLDRTMRMTSIDDACAMVLFRVLQESLTNIARHARAKNVMVRLTQQNQRIMIEVIDDGKGFDVSKVSHTSFGLQGMRERMQAVGGELEVTSRPGQGARIVALLPVDEVGVSFS